MGVWVFDREVVVKLNIFNFLLNSSSADPVFYKFIGGGKFKWQNTGASAEKKPTCVSNFLNNILFV